MRSEAWFEGDNEVALDHRVAFRNAGMEPPRSGQPVIGILCPASDVNPCDLPLRALVDEVKAGIRSRGGIGVELPVMSLGEDLMKPTAMLYRNLLAMEVEEYLRSYPLDGAVILGGCDKSIPGAVMGALSAGLPFLVVTSGSRRVARFEGSDAGAGTAMWRIWEQRRAGLISDERWQAFETKMACGPGVCNVMGTASTMAVVAEALGLVLPGTSLRPSGDPLKFVDARRTGECVTDMVTEGSTAREIVTDAAIRNAVRTLHAVGGSTNAVLHLLAIAGRATSPLTLDDFNDLGRHIPVVADIQPSGSLLIADLHDAGGVLAVMTLIRDRLELDALSATGASWSQTLTGSPAIRRGLIDPADALLTNGSLTVLRGSLAPDGAVVKTSAMSPRLRRHRGRAVVFDGYHDMLTRMDDPDLDVTEDDVLVLAGAGPVGVPGMPEWGMLPLPARLTARGVDDMVRISDSRMSGTSFGTCILHVAPEGAVGGPIGLVRTGDPIVVDVDARRLDIEIPTTDLAARRERWVSPAERHHRGWPKLYRDHVMQANTGCDFDFLRPGPGPYQPMVEPVIGRS